MLLQNAIAQQQTAMDQLNEDAHNARRLVEKSRSGHRGPHSDMDRLDDEVNRLNSRWTNICGQLVDRLRSAETAYALAQQLEHAYRNEVDFVDESYNRLEMENAKVTFLPLSCKKSLSLSIVLFFSFFIFVSVSRTC